MQNFWLNLVLKWFMVKIITKEKIIENYINFYLYLSKKNNQFFQYVIHGSREREKKNFYSINGLISHFVNPFLNTKYLPKLGAKYFYKHQSISWHTYTQFLVAKSLWTIFFRCKNWIPRIIWIAMYTNCCVLRVWKNLEINQN